jgi:hypothetical protein
MEEDEIIAEVEMSGILDVWIECLCMRVNPDGSVTLASKTPETLGYEGDFHGAVVWPDGSEPEGYDPENNSYEFDPELEEPPLPVSIAGKKVASFEDGNYLGEELLLVGDDAIANFAPGEAGRAREWVLEYYGDWFAKERPDALDKIERVLRKSPN